MASNDPDLLDGERLQKAKSQIQHLAITQLLHNWNTNKGRHDEPFYWGDEIECLLLRLDQKTHSVFLEQVPWDALEKTQEETHNAPSLQPELGTFMLETTPSKPFGDSLTDLLHWEADFRSRRKMVNEVLDKNSRLITLPYYPRYGAEPRSDWQSETNIANENPITWSNLVSDNSIASVARYRSILSNIVQRRGRPIDIRIPVFRDSETGEMEEIRMDSTLFGATGCSLQVTMQAADIHEACRLHDGLLPLAPVLLALSAGTPVFRGFLADTDARWSCFGQSVDDRTKDEILACEPSRLRVSSSTAYVSPSDHCPASYHLTDLDMEGEVRDKLIAGGLPEGLALHFASILSRDPLYASQQELDAGDVQQGSTCEGLLANMYHTVRLKPPSDAKTGWRVEFRPMESQVTDFENAAFCIFVILAARLILDTKMNLYVPLAAVETSLDTACARQAATEGRFAFRSTSIELKSEYGMLTAEEIMTGVQGNGGFEGMIPLIKGHLEQRRDFSEDQRVKLRAYLDFLADRACGRKATTARWMREFVQGHSEYRQDSVVSERITFDLIQDCINRSTQ